jgi:hypothetical protein
MILDSAITSLHQYIFRVNTKLKLLRTNSGCKLGIEDARCTGLGQHSTVFRCMLTSRFNMHQSLALVPILHFNPQNVGTTPSQYRLGVSVCMHFLVNYPHRYI